MFDCPRRQPTSDRNARPAGVLALVLMLLLLAGCASAPRLDDTTRAAVAPRVLLDDVPFHGQRDYQCGPASLAMTLQHDGVETDVDALIPQVFTPGREGSVQPEMLATVRRHGRIPFVIEGRLDALLTELDAGHPVVVMQNLSLPAWPLWHYAVAIGYDLEAREMILHSGTEAQRVESFRPFDATWARSDRWAFVALSPGELPSTIAPQAALQAIGDFEAARGAEAALPAWEALASRFPDHAMAHFALGNARHAEADLEGAIGAFRDAVASDATLAPAWLNLGLALESAGRSDEALDALRRAAALPGRWQPHSREAFERLSEEARRSE
ncbi:PA2778 family cysteine peptidase [Halomonas sp. SSL-5]|uniref:PA2778 family cysteine peptidase n=1 Tax=Halomonas sp. SSL-5 TaxID=3065855 RepID=UPI0027389835|nr:PA2778 family cysteine peptidase [Halomonas sp. SSL-5]MDY7115252.1 PA2778 family cysteine peptidase [Halomonas sp. SSL-5]